MPFVELHKSRQNVGAAQLSEPNMAITVDTKGVQHVYIRLPRALVHQVWGNMLVNEGRSVILGVLEGTDTDTGFIMLAHNPRGYTFSASAYAKADGTPSESAFTCKVNLDTFKAHAPNMTPQAPTTVQYSIDGPAVLIQLPPWFVPATKVEPRATMVPLEKQRQGAPSNALLAQQRRTLR